MKSLMLRLGLPLLLLLFAAILINGSAQKGSVDDPSRTHYCAQEWLHQAWMGKRPSNAAKHEAFERELRQYMDNKSLSTSNRSQPPPYVLPVVVHIVHDGGAENLSDAQIFQGIQDLNNAFANVGYYDQGTGVNTEIQFCLARRDPEGNSSNGITRDQNALTDMVIETEDIALKNLNRWEPNDYINIWVVRSITSAFAGPGVAGYAYFPTSHGQPEDGIVMEANFFGSSQGASGVIIHEMGHYLGLYHTFQGGCANNDCLADGDRVCDTPPDQSTAAVPCNASPNSCNTDTDSGFATDQPDMFINYMDYGDFDCYSALTQGQTDRMHFSIENVRQSLLESDGCLDPCTLNITADFTASATTINAGESVTFTNASTNANSYDWQIDGVSFSNDPNPTYVFNTVGTFQIIMYATNADPNCRDTDTVYITVNCPTVADFTGAVQFPTLGQTLNLTNTSVGADSYEWLINGVSQSTDTDFDYTFDISGNYTICLDAVGPFCDDTECTTVFVFENDDGCESTFIKTFGLPGVLDDGYALSESDNGGFFMAGGSGTQSMIIKVDPTGTVAWARTLNLSPQDDQIRSIKLDSDGMLIGCGHATGGTDVSFFFKYDHVNDDVLWVRNITVSQSRQWVILEKGPGENYVATGQFEGCSQASVVELDRNTGAIEWRKSFALGNCQTFSKAIIADGSIFTTGRYNFAFGGTNKMRGGITRMDFDGNQLWSRLYLVPVNPNNARMYPNGILEDNGHLISISQGDDDGISIPNVDLQLYSVDLDGNIEWARKMFFPAANTERARGVVNLPDGYLLMAQADFGGALGTQICLVKTDKDGNIIWSKHYGGPDDDDALNLLVNNGFIQFIGRAGTGTNAEFYLARLNLEGETLEACDQIFDLEVNESDFVNPYDGFHPMTVTDINSPGQPFASSTTEVEVIEQAICESACTEICDNGIDDDNDGYVDCYDIDCPCNTDVCNVTEIDQNFSTQLAWQSTVDEVAVNGTPIVANLDPQVDSIAEIISIVSGASATAQLSQRLLIFKGDGSNAASPQILPIQGGYDIYSAVNPAVGDVDRNGIPDLVMVSGDRRLRVYTNYDANANPAMEEWIVSPDLVDNRNRKPYLADFNGDGISEIYVGEDVYQFDFSLPIPTLRKELSGGSSAGLNYYDGYGQPNCSPVAVDLLEPQHCNGDPDCNGLELVAGNIIYSVDLFNNDGDGFQIKIQRNLNIMQNQNFYLDGYTSVADLNLDGILDVVVSSGRDNDEGIYVWDRNGLLGWFEHQPPPLNALRSGALPCVANVYDDTQAGALIDYPEIIVSSQGFLNCYSLNADALGQPDGAWWIINTTDFSGNTGATVFDFNGDGLEEIIYRDEDNLRIMYGGAAPFPAGVDADRNWSTFVCGSGTFEEHPVIADVDNDSQAEIAVTGYTFPGTNNPPADYRGRLRVFEADLNGGEPWMSARPIWNQFNYFVTNINDDLSVPAEQQLHHLELPQVGSNYRPLNRFVAQIPLLDNNFESYLPVPDATISATSSGCWGDSILVDLTVCNEGSALLPNETPITFYLGNPLTEAVAPHHTIVLGADLAVDSCVILQTNISIATGTFFVTVNDDGSQPTPYDFGSDFPVTSIAECNYVNNPSSFNFNYLPPPPLDLGPDQFFCDNGVANLDAGPGWSTYRWQDGFPDQTYTAWEAGTYWVEVTDSCGRMFSDTVMVEIDSANQFDLGPDTTLCLGQSLTIDVPGFDEYEWLPDDGLSCTNCNPITVEPTSDTTYTLVARDANGCISVDSLQVQLGGFSPVADTIEICSGDSVLLFGNFQSEPGSYTDTIASVSGCDTILTIELELLPLLEASDTIQICSGDSILLFGNFQSEPGSYTDTVASASGCDTILTIELELLPLIEASDTIQICPGDSVLLFGNFQSEPGSYTDTVASAIGCDTILTIELELLPLLEASDTIQICPGDSILLFGNFQSEPGSYTDTVASAIGCDTILTIELELLPYQQSSETIEICSGDSALIFGNYESVAGIYSDTLTSSAGCPTIQTVTLNVRPPLDGIISIDSQNSCSDLSDGSAIVSISGSSPPLQFSWSNGTNGQNLENVPPGTYRLTVSDPLGCTLIDSVTILEGVVDSARFETQPASCFGSIDGTVFATDFEPGTLFSLTSLTYTSDTVFTNLVAGTFNIYTLSIDGCELAQEITIDQPPPLVVALPPDATIEFGDSLQIIAQTSIRDGLSYIWLPPEWLSCLNCSDPWSTPFEDIVYTLTITDSSGCTASDEIAIQVIRDIDVYVPSGFSPNNDGVNDRFTVFAGQSVVQIRRMMVFDRWGEMVFEGINFPPNNQSLGWDGSFRGRPMNSAVFTWVVQVEYIDGTIQSVAGDVTLIR